MWTWCLTKLSLWISARRSQLGFGISGYEMSDRRLEIIGNILNPIIAKQNYRIPFQLFYSKNNIFSVQYGHIQTSNILGPPSLRMAYPSHKFLFLQLNFLCLILTEYPQVFACIPQEWWREITSSPDSLLNLGLSLGREWDGEVRGLQWWTVYKQHIHPCWSRSGNSAGEGLSRVIHMKDTRTPWKETALEERKSRTPNWSKD